MITLEQALVRVGEELKAAMQNELKSNGSYNTGDLANSITYEVRQNGLEYELVRRMLAYGNYVDQGIGRGPGRMPPVRDIMDWIQLKRIPVPTNLTMESFAFAIAKNIGKRGTDPRPRPFINNSISKIMRDTGDNLIAEGVTNEIVQAVNQQLQSLKVTA
jgi:hypothetical protein